jgi:hypothetical protein
LAMHRAGKPKAVQSIFGNIDSYCILHYLLSTSSCHASPKPMYPCRLEKKTGATILLNGPSRPRGNRSDPRHCPPQIVCRAVAPVLHRSWLNHKTRGKS